MFFLKAKKEKILFSFVVFSFSFRFFFSSAHQTLPYIRIYLIIPPSFQLLSPPSVFHILFKITYPKLPPPPLSIDHTESAHFPSLIHVYTLCPRDLLSVIKNPNSASLIPPFPPLESSTLRQK